MLTNISKCLPSIEYILLNIVKRCQILTKYYKIFASIVNLWPNLDKYSNIGELLASVDKYLKMLTNIVKYQPNIDSIANDPYYTIK